MSLAFFFRFGFVVFVLSTVCALFMRFDWLPFAGLLFWFFVLVIVFIIVFLDVFEILAAILVFVVVFNSEVILQRIRNQFLLYLFSNVEITLEPLNLFGFSLFVVFPAVEEIEKAVLIDLLLNRSGMAALLVLLLLLHSLLGDVLAVVPLDFGSFRFLWELFALLFLVEKESLFEEIVFKERVV